MKSICMLQHKTLQIRVNLYSELFRSQLGEKGMQIRETDQVSVSKNSFCDPTYHNTCVNYLTTLHSTK